MLVLQTDIQRKKYIYINLQAGKREKVRKSYLSTHNVQKENQAEENNSKMVFFFYFLSCFFFLFTIMPRQICYVTSNKSERKAHQEIIPAHPEHYENGKALDRIDKMAQNSTLRNKLLMRIVSLLIITIFTYYQRLLLNMNLITGTPARVAVAQHFLPN